MAAREAYLDQMIAIQYRALRYYLIFTASLVVLGIPVMATAYLSSGWLIPDAFRSLFGIGGAFVSSLSALQIFGDSRSGPELRSPPRLRRSE